MAAPPRLICKGAELTNGGPGVRFEVERDGRLVPAFAVRHQGRVHAYLNRCAHIGLELDWVEGRFFDDSGLYFICAAHGALYRPADGVCLAGPCAGDALAAVPVREEAGGIFLD